MLRKTMILWQDVDGVRGLTIDLVGSVEAL
jgi:hypothetical protein